MRTLSFIMSTFLPSVLIASGWEESVIAAMLVGEAASEGKEGMEAVMAVVMTRSEDGGKSLIDVVRKPKAFSALNEISYGENGWGEREAEYVRRMSKCSTWKTARKIAFLGSRGFCSGHRVNHYHNLSVKPYWAVGKDPVLKIGNHVFYYF